MRHIKTLSIIAFIAIILSSCTEQTLYFSESLNNYDYNDVERSEECTGEPIIDDAMGAYSLNVVDTIICLANRQRDKLFSLYNLSGDSIVSIGRYGQGPADFTNNRMNRQNIVLDKIAGLWIIDVNSAVLKRLNLSTCINTRNSSIDSIIAIRPMVKNAFIVGDTLVQEIMANGNFDISLSTVNGGKLLFDEPLYRHTVDTSELFTFYDGTMGVSPDGRYLVIAMLSINQVNILELSTGQRSAVSVGGVKGPDYVLNRENMLPVWTYYSDVSLGDKYIYALYENQPYSIGDNKNNNSELHIFDYAGNIVRIIPLGRFLYAISYSKKNNSIYGLDDNETIWKYNMTDINL